MSQNLGKTSSPTQISFGWYAYAKAASRAPLLESRPVVPNRCLT